jgi:hypothetical protein
MTEKQLKYIGMFFTYCREHSVWVAICTDGSIDQITHCDCDVTIEPSYNYKIWTKKGYKWLVREIEQIEREDNVQLSR